MNDIFLQSEDVWQLVQRFCDGVITPTERDRLEGYLRADVDARQLLVAYLGVHAELQWRHRGHELAAMPPAPQRSPIMGFLSGVLAQVGSSPVAIVLLVGLVVYGPLGLVLWQMGRKNADPNIDRPVVATPAAPRGDGVIARLAEAVDCRWAKPVEPTVGAALPRGPLTLEAGVALIEFGDGAQVVLEGPARFDVQSAGRGRLELGKLRATVPLWARGFVVETPTAKLTDLGTEFGAVVTETKDTEVHVVRGEVLVEGLGEVQSSQSPRRLVAGEGLRVFGGDRAAPPVRVAAQTELFPTAPPKAGNSNYQKWQTFSQRLRTDPALIAYYDFERDDRSPKKLVNRATVTAGRLDGTLGDTAQPNSEPTWVPGRWREKGALRFTANAPQVLRVPSDPILTPGNNWSAVAWILPDRAFQRGVVITKRVAARSSFQLGAIGTYDNLGDSHCIQLHLGDHAAHSDHVLPDGGRWMLLATVRRGPEVTFFLDGKQISRRACDAGSLSLDEPMEIGCWSKDPGSTFPGTIDEVAIFNRALTAAEIQAMYEAGTP